MSEESGTEEKPGTERLSRSRSIISGSLLGVILLGALMLQVYGINRQESTFDDRLMMESSLLLVEGYHPYFSLNYAMPSTWLWAIVLNGGALLGNWPEITAAFKSGSMDGALRAFSKSRWEAYLYPNEVINRLRWINALAAVGVVLAACFIAFRLSGYRMAGFAAASICAVSPLVVEWGANFHPDQFQALGAAGCIYFSLGEACRKGNYQWLAAAIFCSVGIASKFIAAPFWATMMLAVWLGGGRRFSRAVVRRMAATTVVMLASYIILAPYIIVDFALFMKRMLILSSWYYKGETGYQMSPGVFVLLRGLRDGLGYGASALAVIGIAWGLKRRLNGTIVLLAGILFYCLPLSSSQNISVRYTFTLVPLCAALAGVALAAISKRVPPRASVPVALLLLVASLPLPGTIRIIQKRANGDTRTAARQWVVENVPAGSRVFVGFFGPYLQYDRDSVERWRDYFADLLTEKQARLFTFKMPPGAVPLKERPTKERASRFPSEFFRETMLHEEKYFFKKFCYLSEVDELPKPGYDFIELATARNDPGLLAGVERYWIVGSDKFFNEKPAPGIFTMLQEEAKRNGKLVARFSNRDMTGRELFIYEVER